MTTTPGKPSLYDRLGGYQNFEAVVDEFYRRALADRRVSGYFDGMDMRRQRRMLASFLAMAADGPVAYDGRSLAAAHAGLGIGDEEFDVVLVILGETLHDLGVSPPDAADLAELGEGVRDQVLGRASVTGG